MSFSAKIKVAYWKNTMELQTISPQEKPAWDNFIKQSPFAPFQQTFAWGNFQKSLGRKVFYLALKEKNRYFLTALVIKHPLPLKKSYLYIPRGPIINQKLSSGKQIKVIDQFLDQLRKIAKQENAVFARFDPAILKNSSLGVHLTKKYQSTTGSIKQPENTLILNLDSDEEKILSEMKSKTRYNTRLAVKRGVTIKTTSNLTDFLRLNRETTKRDKFQGHEDAYYQNLLKFFTANPEVKLKLLIASYQNKVIAGIILAFYHNTAFYLHGASSYEYRNVMAPHLLQWTGIKIAKKLGLKYYDFWGIAPADKPKHPWSGVTRFKLGFGGKEINYIPAREFAFDKKWYSLMRVIKKFF